MAIDRVNVWGIEESLRASGYPKRTEQVDETFEEMLDRGMKLGKCKTGTGHDVYLNGIVVQFDWTHSISIIKQLQRYNFIHPVSSESTMHMALKMISNSTSDTDDTGNTSTRCTPYVTKANIEVVEEIVKRYEEAETEQEKEDLELILLDSLPTGFMLRTRYTTNYRQLKTIYLQRKHHKLPMWKEFIEMCNQLPFFLELTGIEKVNTDIQVVSNDPDIPLDENL